MRFVIFAFAVSALFSGCWGLKEININIPQAVVQGSKAILKCLFDLEGDKLYSVKWYRGAGEFYRYTPSEPNPIKQFKIRGFHVIESESNATQVVLKHVTRHISGQFSCEVTADQPSFFTVMKTADLEVVELPKNDPYIMGLKTRYRIGEYLKANCTSERAYPGANLTWYVNGRHVDGPQVHKYRREVDQNYVTSFSTVRIKIMPELFEGGRVKLRCSASVYHIYHRSQEKSVALDKSHHRQSQPAYLITTTTESPSDRWQHEAVNYQDHTLLFKPNYSPASACLGSKLLTFLITIVLIVIRYAR